MTRVLPILVCLTLLATGCTRKHVATPEEVQKNHDRVWTIESLPASTPTPTEADEPDEIRDGSDA